MAYSKVTYKNRVFISVVNLFDLNKINWVVCTIIKKAQKTLSIEDFLRKI